MNRRELLQLASIVPLAAAVPVAVQAHQPEPAPGNTFIVSYTKSEEKIRLLAFFQDELLSAEENKACFDVLNGSNWNGFAGLTAKKRVFGWSAEERFEKTKHTLTILLRADVKSHRKIPFETILEPYRFAFHTVAFGEKSGVLRSIQGSAEGVFKYIFEIDT